MRIDGVDTVEASQAKFRAKIDAYGFWRPAGGLPSPMAKHREISSILSALIGFRLETN